VENRRRNTICEIIPAMRPSTEYIYRCVQNARGTSTKKWFNRRSIVPVRTFVNVPSSTAHIYLKNRKSDCRATTVVSAYDAFLSFAKCSKTVLMVSRDCYVHVFRFGRPRVRVGNTKPESCSRMARLWNKNKYSPSIYMCRLPMPMHKRKCAYAKRFRNGRVNERNLFHRRCTGRFIMISRLLQRLQSKRERACLYFPWHDRSGWNLIFFPFFFFGFVTRPMTTARSVTQLPHAFYVNI
jgi:hypothetical protein